MRCKSVTESTVEVFLDESSVVDAIFMQSQEMKDTFQAFPEPILLDATYKLNDLRMPLYVMLVVDGNGESEVVALWFVRNEDHATLSRIMKVYAVYIAHKHTHVHTQTI